MSGSPKDPTIEQFLVLYGWLQKFTDHPIDIVRDARSDPSLQKLCLNLWEVERRLREAEDAVDVQYAETVGTDFIVAWRQYEELYAGSVAQVALEEMLGIIDLGLEKPTKTKLEIELQNASADAREAAQGIECAIAFASDNVEQAWRDFPDGFAEGVEDGVAQWVRLTRHLGFDLEGIFRRRELVPFVLVPRHISNRYGTEQLSLFSLLKEAHRAFVFGVPFAAIGLMRSILELVLKQHYGAVGTLEEQINRVSLPSGISRNELHRLRMSANDILHANRGRATPIKNTEVDIIKYLYLLRMLIEQCPPVVFKS